MSTPPPAPPYAPPSAPVGSPGSTPNYLIWSIVAPVFATIFSMLTCCCLPLGLAPGIPAIIFANRANRMASFDDPAAARAAADKARLWCWVTTGTAIAFGLLFCLSLLATSMGWIDNSNWRQMIEQEMQKQQ
jgi:hypothetical protein